MYVFNTDFFNKYKHTFFKVILFCLFFGSIMNAALAQAPGMLEFWGKTTKNNKVLVGAMVTVYRNETQQQEQLKTGRNGKFRLFLMFGYTYKITFSYPGCVDMYMLVDATSLKKERNDIFPFYQTEIPFFETSYVGVNIAKYKKPITKIIYDGKKAFKDDEDYLAEFTKNLLVSAEDQVKIIAEREVKEKADKEKQDAEIKAKNDAAEKVQKEAEEKLAAEQKAKRTALERAIELARLKEEMVTAQPEINESLETQAIHLQREKEAKELLASKNREIKTSYQNDILKLVAENERKEKQKVLSQQKQIAKTNSVINQMKKEIEVKAKTNSLNDEIKAKKKQELENKQYKTIKVNKLIAAAAFAEKSIKINNQKILPDVRFYDRRKTPSALVYIDEGLFKTIRVTTIIRDKKVDTYRKEYYLWSNTNYYKNDSIIDEITYNVEIAFFSSYKR